MHRAEDRLIWYEREWTLKRRKISINLDFVKREYS